MPRKLFPIVLILIGFVGSPLHAQDDHKLAEFERELEALLGKDVAIVVLETPICRQTELLAWAVCALDVPEHSGHAARVLVAMGPEALPPLEALLKKVDPGLPYRAATDVIVRIGAPGHPLLLRVALGSRSHGGTTASRALIDLGEPAIEMIRAELELSTDRKRTNDLIRFLGFFGASALPLLTPYLSDPDEVVAFNALMSIGNLGADAEPALEALIAYYKRVTSRTDRKELLSIFANIGTPPAVAVIASVLLDDEGFMRLSAARAMSRLPPNAIRDEDVSVLIELLQNDDVDTVRALSAEALARSERGEKKVIAALRSQLAHTSLDVVMASAHALAQLSSGAEREAIDALTAALSSNDGNERDDALQALGAFGERGVGALSAVEERMRIGTRSEPFEAAQTLARFGDAGLNVLDAVILGEDSELAETAAAGLARVADANDPRTLEVFGHALAHDSEDVVMEAEWAAGEARIMDEAIIRTLLNLLTHDSGALRQGAAEAFAKIGRPDADPAIPILLERLREPKETRHVAFLKALKALGAPSEAREILEHFERTGDVFSASVAREILKTLESPQSD